MCCWRWGCRTIARSARCASRSAMDTTAEDIDYLLDTLPALIEQLRSVSLAQL